MSDLIAKPEKKIFPYPIKKIILFPENRTLLHQHIEKRFKAMIKNGFVEEVESMYHRGDLTPDLPSMRLVGYRQIWKYLDNQFNYNEMQEYSITATRQLAKRQLTWCKTEDNANYYNPCLLYTSPSPRDS